MLHARLKIYFYFVLIMYMCEWVCWRYELMSAGTWDAREGSSGAGITGSCELPMPQVLGTELLPMEICHLSS